MNNPFLQGLLWILAILVILPAALIVATYLKKVRATSTPSSPSTTATATTAMTGKAVKLGLVLVGYILVYWWIDWSTNPLGKAVIDLTGPISSSADGLVPWALYWAPILAGLAWALHLVLGQESAGAAKSSVGSFLPAIALVVGIGAIALLSDGRTITFNQGGDKFVDLRNQKNKVFQVSIHDTFTLQTGRGKADGMVQIGCAKVIGPATIVRDPKAPKTQYQKMDDGRGFTNRFEMSPEFKAYLVNEAGGQSVQVEWASDEVHDGQPNCQHTHWWRR